MNLFEYDESLNIDKLCGIDEAGRGPLAGPVFAAAVILPKGLVIDGLNDSKKLSEKKREQLFDEITAHAVSYCIASASVEEIDKMNILQATFLAMKRAVQGPVSYTHLDVYKRQVEYYVKYVLFSVSADGRE